MAIKVLSKLRVPFIGTEQNQKSLGPTDSKVKAIWGETPFINKLSFSCMGNDEFKSSLSRLGKPLVIMAGLETHICVLQTAIDLLDAGYEVAVLSDACLSTREYKWESGLQLLKDAGARIMTTETLLFSCLQTIEHPHFVDLRQAMKERH